MIGSLEKHGIVDHDSEMNDMAKYPNGSYHSLESILIKLASLCDIKDDYEPLDTEEYKKFMNVKQMTSDRIVTSKNQNDTVWKPGTGYGYGSSAQTSWDPNEYVKLQKEKDSQIQSVINTIMDNMNNFKNDEMIAVYKILDSSYLIPFIKNYMRGSNILDMSTHIEMYKLLFTFMQSLATDESIFLFDNKTGGISLYDIMMLLYKEAKNVIALTKSSNDTADNNDLSMMICVVYEMIEPIYTSYIETIKKNIEEGKILWNTKMAQAEEQANNINPTHQHYKETMANINFDVCEFKSFHYTVDRTQPNQSMVKRLAREYASFTNSLPIFFESSIFVRINEKDNRMIKILITGPDQTPYDSGCLIFDVFTGNEYPNKNPQMIFLNHGSKRFNPNLYNCGKVCLSLLGTWNGQGGENWSPTTSTLQQLFISVQSQILIPEPYYNEPGYESRYNNASGKEESRQYNNERRLYNMCHTMYDLMIKPELYPEFTDIIKTHFKLKKDYILNLCDKWTKEPSNKFKIETDGIAAKIKEVLEKSY